MDKISNKILRNLTLNNHYNKLYKKDKIVRKLLLFHGTSSRFKTSH